MQLLLEYILDCPKYETWSNCNAHCEKKCSNWIYKNRPCPAICKPGCVCEGELVRDEENGKCVNPKDCTSSKYCTSK